MAGICLPRCSAKYSPDFLACAIASRSVAPSPGRRPEAASAVHPDLAPMSVMQPLQHPGQHLHGVLNPGTGHQLCLQPVRELRRYHQACLHVPPLQHPVCGGRGHGALRSGGPSTSCGPAKHGITRFRLAADAQPLQDPVRGRRWHGGLDSGHHPQAAPATHSAGGRHAPGHRQRPEPHFWLGQCLPRHLDQGAWALQTPPPSPPLPPPLGNAAPCDVAQLSVCADHVHDMQPRHRFTLRAFGWGNAFLNILLALFPQAPPPNPYHLASQWAVLRNV